MKLCHSYENCVNLKLLDTSRIVLTLYIPLMS